MKKKNKKHVHKYEHKESQYVKVCECGKEILMTFFGDWVKPNQSQEG